MNIGVHVSFQIMIFSWYVPRNGISWLYNRSIFSFSRHLYTVLYSGVPVYITINSVGEFPFSTPSPASFVDFSMIDILTVIKWYLIIVLICISMIQYLLMCFFGHLYVFFFWLCWLLVAGLRFSLVETSRGFSPVAVHRLLIAVASLVIERGLQGTLASVVVGHRLSCPTAHGIFLDQGSNLCSLYWQADF